MRRRRNYPLAYEAELEWDRDPESMDYVRVKTVSAGTRTRPVSTDFLAGECVGYAILEDDAPNDGAPGEFKRRVFFLKDHDRPQGGEKFQSGSPYEAVDPLTLGPGEEGEKTGRSKEGDDSE